MDSYVLGFQALKFDIIYTHATHVFYDQKSKGIMHNPQYTFCISETKIQVSFLTWIFFWKGHYNNHCTHTNTFLVKAIVSLRRIDFAYNNLK